jgi:hypothetical protein
MSTSCIICGAEAQAALCRRHSQHMRIYQAMRRVMDKYESQERDAVLIDNEDYEVKEGRND